MIDSFVKYLSKITPEYKNSNFLLAVSGGMDSMLMLWLFQNQGLKFSVANINFNLRGEEADMDSELVLKYCNGNNIHIIHKGFDTNSYARKHKISIQMAARDIRYKWFENLANEDNFDYIGIAHHLDDQSETFFINLLRGTGIAGLHGLSRNKNKIIRPLMFCTRNEISSFVEKNKIPYREDSSNASDKYQRNYIRHHILPEFYNLQTNFSKKLNGTIEYLSELESFANEHIEKDISILKNKSNYGIFKIEKHRINTHSYPHLICYNIFSKYGFNRSHIEDLISILKTENSSGKSIKINEYTIQIERQEIVLIKNSSKQKANNTIIIESIEDSNWEKLKIKVYAYSKENYKVNNSMLAFLDMDKIVFPLEIRNWQEGDSFKPFGMKGNKKISDYFIDNKFSKYQKSNTLLLCKDEDIIWIIGHRISNKYAIRESTTNILKLEYYGNN